MTKVVGFRSNCVMLSTAPDEDAVCPACDEIPSEWNVLHLISHEATLEYPRWQQVR